MGFLAMINPKLCFQVRSAHASRTATTLPSTHCTFTFHHHAPPHQSKTTRPQKKKKDGPTVEKLSGKSAAKAVKEEVVKVEVAAEAQQAEMDAAAVKVQAIARGQKTRAAAQEKAAAAAEEKAEEKAAELAPPGRTLLSQGVNWVSGIFSARCAAEPSPQRITAHRAARNTRAPHNRLAPPRRPASTSLASG